MKILLEKLFTSARRLNSSGFTMIEMLLSFAIFCLLASFIPIFFNILFHQGFTDERIQRMEWELFFSQLKKEVQRSDFAEVRNNQLVLTEDEDIVSFQKLGMNLRRQVNYRGNEVVLQNVESICFEMAGQKVLIEAVDTNENTYKASVYLFIRKEIDEE